MSDAHTHDDHGHAHGHDVHIEGVSHATLKGYTIGFLLSVILTAIPFWMVMTRSLHNDPATILAVTGLAAVQIVVHMIYFLHLSPKSESGWNMMALIFTLILVVIVLSGSIWVMYHLNTNMMPGRDMSQMP